MKFRNLTTRPDPAFEELRTRISSLATLEDVLRWAKGQTSYRGQEDFITQDEFTHDGVFPLENGDYAVFGLT